MSIHTPARRGFAATVVVVGWWAGTPSAVADNPVCSADACSFHSPSHEISCEIDYRRGSGMPDTTYCQVIQQPPGGESVRMDTSGAYTVCTGESCLGNPGLAQATLSYGQSAGLGPFSCRSEVAGVTCTVDSGRGFTVSDSGIAPAG
ncbi:hypothetical protein [Mycobacterium parmense]|uniref:Uncharacterized protein n=1 Tax=Mycobacterium parmense TaxID=185642 RepID=A0A7I7YR76_9MYCO|nr:hypothetical protein [Mycobacterium parmense]MCV7348760.1 hypothetical protein [Mycobacterium parmense]ORW49632.1 hypothetical protein AWC20_03305 [Mycobacterium parmense]BBZ44270.1 hypothetical protein MPRM_15510 [Mycobacterium parmense]